MRGVKYSLCALWYGLKGCFNRLSGDGDGDGEKEEDVLEDSCMTEGVGENGEKDCDCDSEAVDDAMELVGECGDNGRTMPVSPLTEELDPEKRLPPPALPILPTLPTLPTLPALPTLPTLASSDISHGPPTPTRLQSVGIGGTTILLPTLLEASEALSFSSIESIENLC